MILEAAYDAAYDPPAPVVAVVCEGRSGIVAPARMLIDTGADCSVLPTALRRTLGLVPVGTTALDVIGGAARTTLVYGVRLRIGKIRIFVEVVAFGDEAILGRDVLAHFIARLDGPRGHLRLSRRSAR